MVYLQDGGYDATLNNAHHGLSRLGKPMVEFVWQLDSTGQPIKSFLHLTTRTGEPNVKGIEMTRRWATDWDGRDPEWFQKNLETCRSYPIRLTVVNEPSRGDPSRVFSQVKWINRRDRWEKKLEGGGQGPVVGLERAIDLNRVAELPEGLAMTMKGVWSAFGFLTSDWKGPEREQKWLQYIAEVSGGKLQIDFTEDDWRKVYEKMIGRPLKTEQKEMELN